MKKIMISALLLGAVLAGTANAAPAQTMGDVAMNGPVAMKGSVVNGIVTREFYDKKGNLLYTIAYYGDKELPAAVRDQVKSVYYDYSILTVEEVRTGGRSVYLVDMEDAKTLKTVRVGEDEMDVIREFERADRP